jgi:hypothetical protein
VKIQKKCGRIRILAVGEKDFLPLKERWGLEKNETFANMRPKYAFL